MWLWFSSHGEWRGVAAGEEACAVTATGGEVVGRMEGHLMGPVCQCLQTIPILA
jgi:hypothetical protein